MCVMTTIKRFVIFLDYVLRCKIGGNRKTCNCNAMSLTSRTDKNTVRFLFYLISPTFSSWASNNVIWSREITNKKQTGRQYKSNQIIYGKKNYFKNLIFLLEKMFFPLHKTAIDFFCLSYPPPPPCYMSKYHKYSLCLIFWQMGKSWRGKLVGLSLKR